MSRVGQRYGLMDASRSHSHFCGANGSREFKGRTISSEHFPCIFLRIYPLAIFLRTTPSLCQWLNKP